MRKLAAFMIVLVGVVGPQATAGERTDSRLGKPKEYGNKNYFPMTVPANKEAWEKRRLELRQQVLVANGLYPMPASTPLKPVIHGKIEREGYTIEKVFFASYPGHYVTGNLYRPTGKSGKLPAILTPHGHWGSDRSKPAIIGRFYQASDAEVEKQLKSGAEKTREGAQNPLQARCAMLARLGCVVFHYDMVGYGDSTQIAHPFAKSYGGGFTDPEAELRLQSFMGLQTYNSVRALDFLAGLPDVDPSRIGVTGASGGGTQTFLLCGIDDRPAAAFPAVMVSTDMQGGCICENCSYLRVGAGNIDLAALMAPRPLGMSAAKDWTWEIETKGLPELKAVYKMYGVPENVMAKAFLQFGHNYNQVSREVMYNFFNKHLKLGHKEPIAELPFKPVAPKDLSVFDAQHPRPKDAGDVHDLRKHMTRQSNQQMQALFESLKSERPQKALATASGFVFTALRVMINDRLPSAMDVEEVTRGEVEEKDGVFSRKLLLSRRGQGEALPAVGLRTKDFDGTAVVWIHPDGLSSLWDKGKLVPAARAILDKKAAILAIDVFGTGGLAKGRELPVNKTYAGYTFGYNRSLLANRVHDILTAVAYAKGYEKTKQVHLIGVDKAGPWVALARSLSGDAVTRTACDLNRFRFENILSMSDEMMLPGALKYGGLPALLTPAAPGELYLHNAEGTGVDGLVAAAYRAAGDGSHLRIDNAQAAAGKVIEWMLR